MTPVRLNMDLYNNNIVHVYMSPIRGNADLFSPPPPPELHEQRAFAYFNIIMDLLSAEEEKNGGDEGAQEDIEMRLAMCCTPCTLQEVDENTLKTVNNRCNVCFEEFASKSDGEPLFLLIINACQHVFHHECVIQWLCKKHTCPLCRLRL